MRLFWEILLKGIYNFITDKNYRTFIKLTAFYGSKKRYTPKKVNAAGYKINIPDAMSFIWQFKEIFVDGQYKFECTDQSPIIYDCGANVGLSVIYFKQLFPQSIIKAFEPNDYILEYLNKNIEKNKITGIEVLSSAVWVHNDGVVFSEDKADTGAISGEDQGNKVKSIRLKEMLESEHKVDFLKLDIEGAEVEVIKDCRNSLKHIQNIFIEYHSFVNKIQELDLILDILTEANFKYFLKPAVSKKHPFLKEINKNSPEMDFQLNIYAYKI